MPTTSVSETNANPAQVTGFMQADAFYSPVTLGQPTDPATGGHSKGPARLPYGMGLTGLQTIVPQVLAAAGASKGTAGVITSSLVKVTATTSAQGTILTNKLGAVVFFNNLAAVNTKVYPPTGGQFASATVNTPTTVNAGKGAIFSQVTATQWAVMKSA